MDIQSFSIIIILTTLISYFILRKYFKIAPRYLLYACLGIFFGLIIGSVFAFPIKILFGEFGAITSPYVLGIVLMIFIEFFIIEGKKIVDFLKERYYA